MKAPWQAEAAAFIKAHARTVGPRAPIPEVYLRAVWAALAAGTPAALVKVNLARLGVTARSMGSDPRYHSGWYALGETLLAFHQGMLAALAYSNTPFSPVHHQRFDDSSRNRNPNL